MNKTKLPSLILILILTLATVIMWVSLDIYRALKSPSPVVVPDKVSQPLTPVLDQSAIKQIESRIFLNDSQIPNNVVNSSPTPAAKLIPKPTITPEASPSSQPVNATDSATPTP